MNWLTIAVIVFLAAMAVYGSKRGLARMCISVAAMAVSLVLVFVLRAPVERFVREHTSLETSVESFVDENLTSVIREAADSASKSAGNRLEETVKGMDLPEPIRELLLNLVGSREAVSGKTGDLTDQLTAIISEAVFSGMIFVLTFILVRVLVWIASILILKASKLPLIRQVNSLAGAVIGLLLGVVILWVAGVVVTTASTQEWGQEALRLIGESPVLDFFYSKNPLLKLLVKQA